MSPAEKKQSAARQTIRRPKKQTHQPLRQPVIVKTTETSISGIRSFEVSRNVLGYVLAGYKYIYTGDLRCEVAPGDIFFLNKGKHYIEEVPDARRPFEQIMFYFAPEQVGRIVAGLSINHNIDTVVRHECEDCHGKGHIVSSGWNALKHFFGAVNLQLRDGYFLHNPTAELLSLEGLIYHIISQPDGCLRTRVLGSTDPEKELLEMQIQEYIFSGITLEELARKNNRSLTSFKKKFKAYFGDPPHRWVVRQRLMHARLQLISTEKTVAQIGAECRLPNISHFIKLFSKEYGMTPANYRRRYSGEDGSIAVFPDHADAPFETVSARNKKEEPVV